MFLKLVNFKYVKFKPSHHAGEVHTHLKVAKSCRWHTNLRWLKNFRNMWPTCLKKFHTGVLGSFYFFYLYLFITFLCCLSHLSDSYLVLPKIGILKRMPKEIVSGCLNIELQCVLLLFQSIIEKENYRINTVSNSMIRQLWMPISVLFWGFVLFFIL